MKKGISLALCAALCLGLLAGCGASSQAGTSGSAPAEKKGTPNPQTRGGMFPQKGLDGPTAGRGQRPR